MSDDPARIHIQASLGKLDPTKDIEVFLSSPSDSPLDLSNELKYILDSNMVTLTKNLHSNATVEEFTTSLLLNKPTVLHIGGHGEFNPIPGTESFESNLIFVGKHGCAEPMQESALLDLVHDLASHRTTPLQVVLLNACNSAKLASKMVDQGVQFAIGWSTEVEHTCASIFAHGFYTFLMASDSPNVPEAFTNALHTIQAKRFTMGDPHLAARVRLENEPAYLCHADGRPVMAQDDTYVPDIFFHGIPVLYTRHAARVPIYSMFEMRIRQAEYCKHSIRRLWDATTPLNAGFAADLACTIIHHTVKNDLFQMSLSLESTLAGMEEDKREHFPDHPQPFTIVEPSMHQFFMISNLSKLPPPWKQRQLEDRALAALSPRSIGSDFENLRFGASPVGVNTGAEVLRLQDVAQPSARGFAPFVATNGLDPTLPNPWEATADVTAAALPAGVGSPGSSRRGGHVLPSPGQTSKSGSKRGRGQQTPSDHTAVASPSAAVPNTTEAHDDTSVESASLRDDSSSEQRQFQAPRGSDGGEPQSKFPRYRAFRSGDGIVATATTSPMDTDCTPGMPNAWAPRIKLSANPPGTELSTAMVPYSAEAAAVSVARLKSSDATETAAPAYQRGGKTRVLVAIGGKGLRSNEKSEILVVDHLMENGQTDKLPAWKKTSKSVVPGLYCATAKTPTAAYFIGGLKDGLTTNECYQFDFETGGMKPWMKYPHAIRDAAAAYVDSRKRIIVSGGMRGSTLAENFGEARRVDAYDMGANRLIELPRMNQARIRHCMLTANSGDIVYALGGLDPTSNMVLNSVEFIDTRDGGLKKGWTTLPCMSDARQSFGAAMDTYGNMYAMGGVSNTSWLDSVELLDMRNISVGAVGTHAPILSRDAGARRTTTGEWYSLPHMHKRRSGFAVTSSLPANATGPMDHVLEGMRGDLDRVERSVETLRNGREYIFVSGGVKMLKFYNQQSCEAYDVLSSTWVELPKMKADRGCHSIFCLDLPEKAPWLIE